MTNTENNPVGFLQELCQKHILRFPEYEEIDSSGPDHSRQFTFKCSFEGYEACGLSRQKKQAKSESAKAMVNLLKENGYFDKINANILSSNNNAYQQNEGGVVSKGLSTDIVSQNPISALYEYCQKNVLPAAEFVETSSAGTFICECILNGKKTFGGGMNKKAAKTEAALKLCVELGIKCNGIGYVASESKEIKSEKNSISVLQELCQQKSYKNVEYTEMPQVRNLFVVKCTLDSISCEGMGITKKSAKSQAASNVLEKLSAQDLYSHGKVHIEDNKPKVSMLYKVSNSTGASDTSKDRILEDFKIDSSDEEDNTNDEMKPSQDTNINLNVKLEELNLEDSDNNLDVESDSKTQEAQEGPVESC